MHNSCAVGAHYHDQTQKRMEEKKIITYREYLSPEITGGNFFTTDFSSKLDNVLLLHYLVSLLPILIGLLSALIHEEGFLFC